MVSDATRLPEWLGEFEEVVQLGDGPVGEGTVFRYTLSPGPGDRSAILEWVAWDPPRRLAWEGPWLISRLGGARPRGSFEVSSSAPTAADLSAATSPSFRADSCSFARCSCDG